MAQISIDNQSITELKKYFIPMEVDDETIEAYNINKADVKIMLIGNRKKRVYLVPTHDREVYLTCMREEWREQKRNDRQGRCIVPGKDGKPIRCPDDRKCEDCDIYMDIIKEENKPSSLDFLTENGAEPARTDKNIEAFECAQTLDSLIVDLEKIRPEYGVIFRMLYDRETQAKMAEKLGIPPRTISDMVKRVRKHSQELYTR